MKANNLSGDYCMTCAAILDDVQRNHRPVVVLDSQCAMVFHQSGDAARLLTTEHHAPAIPAAKPETKHTTAEVQETVHAKASKSAKPAKGKKR
jgi:hypothetical protein